MMKAPHPFLCATVFAGLLVFAPSASCAPATPPATVEETDEFATPQVTDPLGPMNRALFKFNDGFYRHLLRPFAHGYERVVPAPARRGLGNFFDNIRFPMRFVSCVLQVRPKRAARETGKFLLNSTVGVAGLVRVSDSVPALANVPPEDTGQAFGRWGIGAGPYLVLPFLGPNSLRDTVGLAGDIMLNPLNWSATEHAAKDYDFKWRLGLSAVDFMNASPDQMRVYDSFRKSAVDPYTAVRNGYLQYRAAAVKK